HGDLERAPRIQRLDVLVELRIRQRKPILHLKTAVDQRARRAPLLKKPPVGKFALGLHADFRPHRNTPRRMNMPPILVEVLRHIFRRAAMTAPRDHLVHVSHVQARPRATTSPGAASSKCVPADTTPSRPDGPWVFERVRVLTKYIVTLLLCVKCDRYQPEVSQLNRSTVRESQI